MSPLATLRPMTPPDVRPAADLVLRGGWGDRSTFLSFAASDPECHPVLAELNGEIVGTGVGTRNGTVGWVGAIFVAEAHRRRGLGRALTEAIIEHLELGGCRSLVLVATDVGRPLYERLGFVVDTAYHVLRAAGLATARLDPVIRTFEASDLAAAAELDRVATGEDRTHLLRAFAASGDGRNGWVLPHTVGTTLRGFILRAPWGGGATIAPDPADAVRLLDHRRSIMGPERELKAGLLAENREGLELLRSRGWTEAWSAVRMIRGDALTWQPSAIWGQFNHAIG